MNSPAFLSQDQQQFVKDTLLASVWNMETLQAVQRLNLPDWAIGAGFVRNAVWDRLHAYNEPSPLADIDVLYFDSQNSDRARETALEDSFSKILPGRNWSVRNQARMHLRNNDCEYHDTEDAISHWLETPTCVAVRLDDKDALHLIAPYGLDDLLAMQLRPTPMGRKKYDQYLARLRSKNWSQTWPNVTMAGLTDADPLKPSS